MMMKIAIGADHAGYEYKKQLNDLLAEQGHKIKNYGTDSLDSVDYPDFAHPVASAIAKNEYDFGILICGSGNGVAITANKHQEVRAALCWNETLAALARQHNNANILCIPARFIEFNLAKKIIEIFLSTDFEGGRHDRRVTKIACS